MITIYTIAYNEEVMLPFMIKWYRERFPECKIVVYDNFSTDKTEEIALSNDCQVVKYDSNNQIRDDLYLEIKNNCWKTAETDWVLICDVDEFLDIQESDLINETSTIITSEGWNMINTQPNPNLELKDIKWGTRAKQYDKAYLFNKKFIKEIRYSAGCHSCNPSGKIKYSSNLYKLFHFKAISEDYMIQRHTSFAKRMSEQNIKNDWGVHYFDTEETIRRNYTFYQTHPELIKVID